MMTIIVIEKDSAIYEKNIKPIMLTKLYSVCGYRTNKDFEKLHEWKFDENTYELYGKKSGKKDKENNFKFPDINETYYGSLCIIKKNGSISLDEWNMFYMSFTYNSKEDENDLNHIESERESERESENESTDSQTYSHSYTFKFTKSDIEMNHNDIERTYEEYEEEI
jgi:hypothetical protein